MIPAPQLPDFRIPIPTPDSYESVLSRYIRRLERRAAAWARSARNNREDSHQWMRCAGEKERVNQEQQRRIIQLICERDRLQYRAQERRALRTEIEAALGMESLPGDVEDSSLKRGLAIIAGWKQEIASLKKEVEAFKKNNRYQRGYSHGEQSVRADLARVTAERDEQVNELVDARDQIYEQGRRACELFDLNRTTQKELAALRARNSELEDLVRQTQALLSDLLSLPKASEYPDGPSAFSDLPDPCKRIARDTSKTKNSPRLQNLSTP